VIRLVLAIALVTVACVREVDLTPADQRPAPDALFVSTIDAGDADAPFVDTDAAPPDASIDASFTHD
jgi:hypothetical protein